MCTELSGAWQLQLRQSVRHGVIAGRRVRRGFAAGAERAGRTQRVSLLLRAGKGPLALVLSKDVYSGDLLLNR